ncbi:unnamed protein product [Protopolystoma xenopodis]|uniref:Uncharacterized protein n=1 Tax=Protopolystoma xenopodis TaxID=117903 RepID=A0A448X1L6_9PLAT|nr:unnamed protein product [Protopolystoma xenopodis]
MEILIFIPVLVILEDRQAPKPRFEQASLIVFEDGQQFVEFILALCTLSLTWKRVVAVPFVHSSAGLGRKSYTLTRSALSLLPKPMANRSLRIVHTEAQRWVS